MPNSAEARAREIVEQWLHEDQRIGLVVGQLTTGALERKILTALTTFAAQQVREAEQRERKLMAGLALIVLNHVINKQMSPTDFYSPEQFRGLVEKEWVPEFRCRAKQRC